MNATPLDPSRTRADLRYGPVVRSGLIWVTLLSSKYREEITSAKSVSKIFIILSPYWNYLDFEILVYIINHYGTHGDDSDEKRLQNYEKALKKIL